MSLKKIKPEQRNLREHPALVRDAGGEYVVESRDAVGGNKKQAVAAHTIHVADFAAGEQFEVGEVGLSAERNRGFR